MFTKSFVTATALLSGLFHIGSVSALPAPYELAHVAAREGVSSDLHEGHLVRGHIKVVVAESLVGLGFLGVDVDVAIPNSLAVVDIVEDAIEVAIADVVVAAEVTILGSDHHEYPFLGIVGTDLLLGDTSATPDHIFTWTKHTDAGAPYSDVGNAYGDYPSESSIWKLYKFHHDHELRCDWVNKGGVVVDVTVLVYLPKLKVLTIVADLAVARLIDIHAVEVKLIVVA